MFGGRRCADGADARGRRWRQATAGEAEGSCKLQSVRPLCCLVLLLSGLLGNSTAAAQDLDRDGLPDALEQALLERFLPTFVISAGECDGLPASMLPDRRDPVVAERDGTVYGHVSRVPGAAGVVDLEIKYFHLWGRDCGRPSHDLDVERVSTLVRASSIDALPDAWRAVYWYAAAHEGTVCDASSGAAAETLRASNGGPFVYVSRGKHASYLNRGHCKWGCGSDLCDPGSPSPHAAVVNVGEIEAPLNGATWIRSGKWSLAAKLAPDLNEARRAQFDARPTSVLALRIGLRPYQAPILGGDTGLDALVASGEAALDAVTTGAAAAGTAVESAAKAVGTSVTGTVRGIRRFLRLR